MADTHKVYKTAKANKPKPLGAYTVEGSRSEMGRSRLLVRCRSCFHLNTIFKWSWAGHTYYKCRGVGCDKWLPYEKP